MRWSGLALSAFGLLMGALVLLGMIGDPKGYSPSLILGLPWLGFVLAAVGAGVLWREPGWAPLANGVALAVHGGAALAVISLGVAAERQNYWDAIHFASLFWCATASAVLGLVVLARAARRAGGVATTLAWLNGVLVFVCAVLWAWMTLPPVQELQGWIARTLYLLSHG